MVGPVGFGGEEDGRASDRDEAGSPEQLVLTDPDDERLPWLEASDFEDVDSGLDVGRIAGFGLLFLLVAAAAVAAFWYLNSRDAADNLQPEGTTIAAPKGPYKVRPTEAGGKTFEGTGDTSFAVGEGQRREGRLAADTSGEPEPQPTASPAPESSPAATPDPPSGPVVQVGAYANRADARIGWQTLMRQTDKLNGVSHRIVEGQADIGTVFRLQAVPGSLKSARELCAALKSDGVACQVKR